jgi:putative transcription antitermination factor YqgF
MKYLGIDYGKRKVGLAISEGMTASPLTIIDSSSLVDALQKVKLVIERQEIECVVVGLAESGESRSMTEKFINELKKEIRVEVFEETLSSHLADERMRTFGVKKDGRANNDAFAAAIILEDYLTMRKEE